MAFVETPDGVPLYYDEQGEGEQLLLVHGWTMNSEYWWQKNVGDLTEDHHVVTFDLRGHGNSGKTDENHTLEHYARDLRHLIQQIGLDDVMLVGWSMGAAVVLTYLDQFGADRLRAVGLVDQSPRFFSADDWEYPLFGEFTPDALAEVVENLRADRSATARGILESFFVEPPPEATLDEMYAETAKTPTSVATAVLEDMATTDLRDVVAAIDVPTILLYGEQSVVFPGVGEWMHDQIPDSELVLFPESGHAPFWEEPETFNGEVTAFAEKSTVKL